MKVRISCLTFAHANALKLIALRFAAKRMIVRKFTSFTQKKFLTFAKSKLTPKNSPSLWIRGGKEKCLQGESIKKTHLSYKNERSECRQRSKERKEKEKGLKMQRQSRRKLIVYFQSRARDSISRFVGRSVGPSVAVSSEHATYGDRPCYPKNDL